MDVEKVKKRVETLIFNTSLIPNSDYSDYCKYALELKRCYTDKIRTMAVGYSVDEGLLFLINPTFCEEYCKSDSQILCSIAHEVRHIIYSHLKLHYAYDLDEITGIIANIACDVHVNIGLNDLPTGGVTLNVLARILDSGDSTFSGFLNDVKHKRLYKMSSTKCLALLDTKSKRLFGEGIVELAKTMPIGYMKEDFIAISNGSEASYIKVRPNMGVEATRFAKEILRYTDINPIIVAVAMGFNGEVVSIGDVGDIPIKCIKDKIKEVQDSIKAIDAISENSSGGRSLGGDSDMELKVSLGDGSIPWNSIIKASCISKLRSDSVSTKRRVNRRQPNRLELSGKRKSNMFRLFVACDVSGSIRTKEYSDFITEVISIAKTIKCELEIATFTNTLREVVSCNTSSTSDTSRVEANLKIRKEYGGTSFDCIFNYLDEEGYPKDIMVIVFTDGCGESKLNFRGFNNRKWILSSNSEKLSVQNEVEKNILSLG